jgi:hypothetical protein
MVAPTQGAAPTPAPISPTTPPVDQKDRGFLVDGIQQSRESTLDLSQSAPEQAAASQPEQAPVQPETPSEQQAPVPETTVEPESTPEASEAWIEAPLDRPLRPDERLDESPTPVEPPVTPAQAPVPLVDPLYKKIEGVLEEDLVDAYKKMDPELQAKFKAKGEETASKIRELVSKAKVNTSKIFKLIRKWLKMIPGVNRFFLEQEAKIKTDKINLITAEAAENQDNTIT